MLRQYLTRFVAFSLVLESLIANASPAILIYVDEENHVRVMSTQSRRIDIGTCGRGLVIWADGDREHWQFFDGQWTLPRGELSEIVGTGFGAQSRGSHSLATDDQGSFQTTTALAQLRLMPVARGLGSLVVPYENAMLLDPRVTFRRETSLSTNELASAEAVLRQDGKELLRIRFPEGASILQWKDIPDIPTEFKDGLLPGSYEFDLPGPLEQERCRFKVASATDRENLERNIRPLAALLQSDSPLVVQVTVEQLLSHRPALLADALNQLEQFPEAKRTKHLKDLHQQVIDWLKDPAQRPRERPLVKAAYDDEKFHEVRTLIASNSWVAALEELDSLELFQPSEDLRRHAVALTYRGVILGESGAGRDTETIAAFQQAIEQLSNADEYTSDLQRAYVNYANFLLGRVQDRIHNHAFQMATGTARPLMTAISQWMDARDVFARAKKLSISQTDVQPDQLINEARLYALLADIVHILGHPTLEGQQFRDAERVAIEQARMLAECASHSAAEIDPLNRASLCELLAHCDFRSGQFERAIAQVNVALAIYVDQGSLAGVENAYRFLGLCARSDSDGSRSNDAINHFLISESLSELLRERYPVDDTGLSRAGFFARRAYVTEHLIDLLVAERRFAEALAHAESIKARSLQDLLALRDIPAQKISLELVGTDQLLAGWPTDTVAVEYFLGSEKSWVFCIDRFGKTTASLLTDNAGLPIPSRELVHRVQAFLRRENPNGMEFYADKLKRRVAARGYDKQWQDELIWFREVLLPDSILAEVKHSKLLVVSPNHVLHYFPFAALVIDKDPRGLSKFELPQPRFLIDECSELIYVPSVATWRGAQSQPAAGIATAAAAGIVAFPGAARLDGVVADLDGLRSSFGSRLTEVLQEEQVTEPAVSRLLRNNGLLLLATHGNNNADRPLESCLLAFSSGQHDGRLTAEEVYRSPVKSDLIVLSACYSGLADRSPMSGDDLFGIQRALLASGARTVVAGLWDVFDKTAPELIAGFHQRLAMGQSSSLALAASQREFLNKYRTTGEVEPYVHPYFWAVYMVAGDNRSTVVVDKKGNRK